MLLVRHMAVVAFLAAACSADGGVAHRFFFPSQSLLLEVPDAKLGAGHGRTVHTSGDVAEGTGSSSREGGRGGHGGGASSGAAEGGSLVGGRTVQKIREPSRCTFAIVGCCRAGSIRIDDHCFQQLQCHGPFWGESPCRRESAVVAHNVVSKYYEAKEAEKRREEEAAAAAGASEPGRAPEPSSPFEPIGPLPSREDAEGYHG